VGMDEETGLPMKQVTYEPNAKVPNCGTLTFQREDHTVGNLLRHQLLTQDKVGSPKKYHEVQQTEGAGNVSTGNRFVLNSLNRSRLASVKYDNASQRILSLESSSCQVRFAAYQMPHPLMHVTHVRVETTEASLTPLMAVSRALLSFLFSGSVAENP